MPPAYLAWPHPVEPLPSATEGCGKVMQARTQAAAVVGRRRRGTLYFCRWCRSWHTTASNDGDVEPELRRRASSGLVRYETGRPT